MNDTFFQASWPSPATCVDAALEVALDRVRDIARDTALLAAKANPRSAARPTAIDTCEGGSEAHGRAVRHMGDGEGWSWID
jgi:hypothetical protein